MKVIICGAGVIGASIAYYLSLRGIGATVVERVDVACAASGKSAGFLALDWCDGTPLESLARSSFELHADLAGALGADYGYRRMDTFQIAASKSGPVDQYRRMASPAWLDGNCAVYSALGNKSTTAQVHPDQFTRALMDQAVARGAALRVGCVADVEFINDGTRVCGVRVDDEIIAADVIVIAMGPWSILAATWMPLPAVAGLKSHSITIRTPATIPPHALFVEFLSQGGEAESPEIVPRPNGEVYVCGISDDLPLPVDPRKVVVNEDSCRALHGMAGKLSGALGEGEITRMQACYRPICVDALPLMGRVPGIDGAYIATGHNCWGILNAPASGLAMAELIAEGESKSVNIAPFDPGRLPRVAEKSVSINSARD
jgi:glycine/D-amino acid oxidase-like deaminating enzyme